MTEPLLNVLILGTGGREHALLKCAIESPLTGKVIAAPGNGGMQEMAECYPVDPSDAGAVIQLAKDQSIGLVIVGPEVPLALGIADELRNAGILVYGPGKKGAELEGSKAYCKQFFDSYNIPTARWQKFSEPSEAKAFLNEMNPPLVVKASGLAAGKGVLICEDLKSAETAISSMLEDKVFGESGSEIVIEEFLEGEEASIMVMISGDKYVCLPPSQDHKRVGEGDTGLNTGGMGAYAPADVVTAEVMGKVETQIIEPTLAGFQKEGIDFRGTLFIGLMIKDGEPKVLEYNVRFGDPECQVLLPLCETDPLQLMLDCAKGTLNPAKVNIKKEAAMIVVLAAAGYPGSYRKGTSIQIPSDLPEGVSVLHAGTRLDENGNLIANGGRVLGVVAMSQSLEDAAEKAYKAVDQIQWEDKYFRRDIGHRQLNK